MQDLQTEFHQQMKALRKELEEEREARIKLEQEVWYIVEMEPLFDFLMKSYFVGPIFEETSEFMKLTFLLMKSKHLSFINF